MNETLQLQSLVHEELGLGTWTREIGKVPTTKPHELLATLDLSDPRHPRFHTNGEKPSIIEDLGQGQPQKNFD